MQNNAQRYSASRESLIRKHESENPKIGRILWAAVSVVTMTVVCVAIIHCVMVRFERERSLQQPSAKNQDWLVVPNTEPLEKFPAPHLQINPSDDLAAMRLRDEAELNSYGWIDRKAGVARIPIARAVELVLERGLPMRTNNAPPRTGKSSEQLIQERSQQK